MPTFSRKDRLRRADEFALVRETGTAVTAPALKVAALVQSEQKLGIIVGRVVGRAVTRNRIRRTVRERFRLARSDFPIGLCVVVARPEAARLTNKELDTELGRLLMKLRRRLHDKNVF